MGNMATVSFAFRNGRKSVASRRRASGYVYFLSTSLLVLAIGVSALMAARVTRRANEWCTDGAAARSHAISGIELGQAIIAQESNWRTNRGSGVWLNNQTIGTGSLTLTASIQSDADANANNNPVILEGTGYEGDAVQKVRVMLIPATTNGGLVPKRGSWERRGSGLIAIVVPEGLEAMKID